MRSLFFGRLVLLFLSCFVNVSFAYVDSLAQRIIHAHEKGDPLPNVSMEAVLDMSRAYQIQTAFVKARLTKDSIAGFKAGLTTQGAQAYFGIDRPIFGVLFKSGDFSQLPVISLKNFNYLMIETELGFITKKAITKTVNSVAELKTYIAQVVPVIELPDVGFAKNPITAIDLVAANTGSEGFIYHKEVNWIGQNLNAVAVSLSHNGNIVNQGEGTDALGDQWEALRWLVNQVLAHGWSIEKGNILITGALGTMIAAEPGIYRAQFNDGATLELTLTH